MALEVELQDTASGNMQRVALPDDVPMRDLLPTVVAKLGVEVPKDQGMTCTLVHKHPGERFVYGDDDTLASRGTKPGDLVGLSYEFVAG